MSYPWWHVQATFRDGYVHDFDVTDMTPFYALRTLLEEPGFAPGGIVEMDRVHGDLVKLEVLHPSTPGLDPATEKCNLCSLSPTS